MAYDKIVDSRQLDADLLSIANAIREKSGSARPLNFPADFVTEIGKLGGDGLTDEIKQAILQLGQKVAYIDAEGQAYYNDLYNALYPPKTVVLLTAVFRQGSTVIYDDTALNDLKQYLTVTAKYDDNTTAILADSAYTLSGLLEAGTSTVTVAYNGLTTTFTVNVTARPTLSSISAAYTQSGTVYDDDTLDSLKADLVVTAHYSDSSTQTVPAADYTLSGTLTVGTSIITVSYQGKTTTFSVTVTKGQIDTTAEIIRSNVVLGHFSGSNPYQDMSRTNGGVTKIYDLDAATTILAPAGIIPTTGNVMYQSDGPASLYIFDANDNIVNYVSVCAAKSSFGRWCQDAEGTMTEYTQQWTVAQYSKIQFSVDTRYLADAYMYDKTTGQVWFAGENTPYYGMTNISEAGGE